MTCAALLAGGRGQEADDELLRTVNAAAYRWQRAAGVGPGTIPAGRPLVDPVA